MLTALGIVVVCQAVIIVGLILHRRGSSQKPVERRKNPEKSEKIVVRSATVSVDSEISRRHGDLDSRALLGALVIEIDHLALVRDALGDGAGYELLGSVASQVQTQLRDTDYLDLISDREIVVVTDELPTQADLERFSDRIVSMFAKPIEFGSRSQLVTASIGMAFVSSDGEASDLVQNAQAAKNRARSKPGTSTQIFEESLKAEALDSLELERELNLALEDNELSVYYQAIVKPGNSQVDRFECFVRWFHETRGMMKPNKFLAVANRSELIVHIGHFVLLDACSQAAEWSSKQSKPVTVAVNVSNTQLLGEDFVGSVVDTLNRTGLPAEQLELEFSERLVFSDLDFVSNIVKSLQRIGVRVAIDNFGATNASLGLLRRLPTINTLKLDRTFIENVHVSETEKNLVASVNDFASQLGIDVVAEGVELAETARTLELMGIEYQQGFLYQRPSPASNAFELDLVEAL